MLTLSSLFECAFGSSMSSADTGHKSPGKRSAEAESIEQTSLQTKSNRLTASKIHGVAPIRKPRVGA